MSNETRKFVLDDLTIQATIDNKSAKVVWTGACEDQDPEVNISPFLQSLMSSLEGKEVAIDFRGCEYINSASITLLFQLIKQLNARKLTTEILYNLEVEWQRITFRSVKVVTGTLPFVRVTGS